MKLKLQTVPLLAAVPGTAASLQANDVGCSNFIVCVQTKKEEASCARS